MTTPDRDRLRKISTLAGIHARCEQLENEVLEALRSEGKVETWVTDGGGETFSREFAAWWKAE